MGENAEPSAAPLPPPSAELWLIGAFVAAHMRLRLKRKERGAFLDEARNLLIGAASLAALRPTEQAMLTELERIKALGWLDAADPIIRALCDL